MESISYDKQLIKQSKYMQIIPYIFYFFIFSFIGWILETIFCNFILGELDKRGFLYAPICPIYRNWCNNFNILLR